MIPAPAIESLKVLPNFILEIKFEGMPFRYVDLKNFPLLGLAKKLITDIGLLEKFILVDGVPEWGGQCLLGPDELLEHSVSDKILNKKKEERLKIIEAKTIAYLCEKNKK